MAEPRKYYYSEVFHSIQGEGAYTGKMTAWLRMFGCNLTCGGFGQKDPTDPSTYDLPYQNFDISSVSDVKQLPVWDKGCDSSYSWSKKYRHLLDQVTAEELAHKIIDVMRNEHNPNGWFRHPNTQQWQHLCITGGEPLMPTSQQAFIEIYNVLKDVPGGPIAGTKYDAASNLPGSITFETNGTYKLTPKFLDFVQNPGQFDTELFFSVSPKLFTVSGEKNSTALRPEVVAQYYNVSQTGQLKFVVGSDPRMWEELEYAVKLFRDAGVFYPVYVMPVGAREEEQTATAGAVAKMAMERGYHVSGRMHVYLFGNQIGT